MGRIAIVVIPGTSDQAAYETVDRFSRMFFRAWENFASGQSFRRRHVLISAGAREYSAVAIDAATRRGIDIVEYRWSLPAGGDTALPALVEWLAVAARGAGRFYQRCPDAAGYERSPELFRRDGTLRVGAALAQSLRIVGSGGSFAARMGAREMTRPYWLRTRGQAAKQEITVLLGALARYAAADNNPAVREFRNTVLDAALEQLITLLRHQDYEQILLAGHALGGVMAVDCLNRLNRRMHGDAQLAAYAAKLMGLISFGAPIDKTAFYVTESISSRGQTTRLAIALQRHGFKSTLVDDAVLTNGIQQYLEHMRWLNFWSATDPISDYISAYRDVQNIEMDFSGELKSPRFFQKNIYAASQALYWESPLFYRRIIEGFGLTGA